MNSRSIDWNVGLSKDLQEPAFARAFVAAALDEGVPLQVALGKVIRAHGIEGYAKQCKMASPNLVRAIRANHNPTLETLNRLLKPLGLRLAVTSLKSTSRRKSV